MSNILVVDDEKEIADLLEVYLKNENYNVYKYYSSIDVLNNIDNLKIDLAILDVMIPEIDGFKLILLNLFFLCLTITLPIIDSFSIK